MIQYTTKEGQLIQKFTWILVDATGSIQNLLFLTFVLEQLNNILITYKLIS